MTGTVIKLLSKLGFKQAIIDFAYQSQSKSPIENMQFAFFDSKGRNYYYYTKVEDMPLPLVEKLTELQEQLRCKLPSSDLDRWIEAVEKVLNNGGKMTDVGYWLGVMKDRRSLLLDVSILTEIAALLYIREDENPLTYNREIHKEKFNMIWNMGGKEGTALYDFFAKAGLNAYIPSQSITRENWNQYLEQFNLKVEAFNLAISRILMSESVLKEQANNSRKI